MICLRSLSCPVSVDWILVTPALSARFREEEESVGVMLEVEKAARRECFIILLNIIAIISKSNKQTTHSSSSNHPDPLLPPLLVSTLVGRSLLL